MIMADVLMWFLIVAGAYLAFVSYWLASAALFSGFVEECSKRYARPWRPAGLGLAVVLPAVVLGVAAANHAPHEIVGAVLKGALLSLILPALVGSAGLALRIGTGLSGAEAPLVRRALRGAAILPPMFLPPFLGWFIVLPFVLVSGFGVTLLVLRASPGRRVAPTSSSIPAA